MSPNQEEQYSVPISSKSINENGHRRPKLNTPKNRKKRRVSDEVFSIEIFNQLTISGDIKKTKKVKGKKSKKSKNDGKNGDIDSEKENTNGDIRLQCLPMVPLDHIPDYESIEDGARSSSVESEMDGFYL